MKINVLRAVCAAAAALALCLAAPVITAADGGAEAVATDARDLKENDRVIIVNAASSRAVSRYASGKRLAPVTVSVSGGAIGSVPYEAAVFEVSYGEDGYVLFRADGGYLTSYPTGNGLFYAETPTEYSLWEFGDGGLLRSVNAEHASQKNNYLEYYPDADYFSTYGRNDPSQDGFFRMKYYLVSGASGQPDGEYRLPLFETSDTHGYLADISGDEYQYRLAYVSDKVKDARGYGGGFDERKAVLLDGGDIYQGNVISNLLEGRSMSAAYEIMGYDAVTVGNHEFDWDIEKTTDPDATMPDYTVDGETFVNDVPLILSNLYKDGEKVGFTKDYVILEKTASDGAGGSVNVKIAVIGFAPDYSSSIMNSRFTGAGFTVDTDIGKVEKLAAELEGGGCDAVVLLTHGEASEAAARLSAGTAIDLVLGGHTHNNLCGTSSSGVRYMQPAAYGSAYAYCELVFRTKGGKTVFDRIAAAHTVRIADEPEKLFNNEKNAGDLDRDTVLLTDMFIADVSEALNGRVGYITTAASKYDYIPGSGERSSTMGNWMASITARAAGAEVAFVNSGGIRVDMPLRVYEGRRDITAADVYSMFPFENRIYCYELTYEELMRALEYSLTPSGSTLLSCMTGVQCFYDGSGILTVLKDGKPIYSGGKWEECRGDMKIRVAVNEYIATSDRPDNGVSNPFFLWKDTDKLISKEIVDRDGALSVLNEEALLNDGFLAVDTTAYYRKGVYSGTSVSYADWSLAGGALTLDGSFAFQDGSQPWEKYALEITSVRFGSVPDLIPAGAFGGCVNLESVEFPGTAEQWFALRIADERMKNGGFVIKCSDRTIGAAEYLCFVNGHVMRSMTVKNPSENGDGVIQHYCERCGYEEYENVPYVPAEDTAEPAAGEKKGSVLVWAIPAASAAVAVPAAAAVSFARKKRRG